MQMTAGEAPAPAPCRLPWVTEETAHAALLEALFSQEKTRSEDDDDSSQIEPDDEYGGPMACPFRAWSHGRHVRFSLVPALEAWSWLLECWGLPILASAARF